MPSQREEWQTVDEIAGSLTPDTPINSLMQRRPYNSHEDKQGHALTLGARFPKWFSRPIDRIMEARGTPYFIKSDLVRDAVYLGLIILSLRYTQSPEWKTEEALARLQSDLEEGIRLKDKVRVLASNLDEEWRNGDKAKATQVLESFISELRALDEDESDKWRANRYRSLLASEPIVATILDASKSGHRSYFTDK